MPSLFSIGQIICLKADKSRQGPIIDVLRTPGSPIQYRVFHAPGEIRNYFEEQICLAGGDVSVEPQLKWCDLEEFMVCLTAARLSHPLTDNLYSLHSARIRFVPFQFKPLLRLLRADRPRLLIADEVGVGKTIEAGLILRELQTRQRVDNVLVVCPKALVNKWRAEMRRFDEDFHALTAETLRYCLRETHYDGVWPAKYNRAIIHLELFRNPDYLYGTDGRNARPGLESLDPLPQFGLTIIDEAHHLRNPATNSYHLARLLCESSEAAIFLSATPIQLGSRNLYTLLNLLRPDLFLDEQVFANMIAPNRDINQAMRHIRSCIPEDAWKQEAVGALNAAAATDWGARVLSEDPRFTETHQQLQDSREMTDSDRVRCLRELEEVHTLAHVMNRTRRRDIGRFTIREPHTISVPFTDAQQAFYSALIEFRREVLALRYDPIVIRLIVDTLERQSASCLPALIPMLEEFLRTGRFSTAKLSDDDMDEELDLLPAIIQMGRRLRQQALALPADDPKLKAFLELARSTCQSEGPGKLLVFSFFLHTLDYLTHKLTCEGFRVALVNGRVPDEEREELRSRFRLPKADPQAIDILLSSEVGCEGLDYEFCDRMVNYDIPWNPMRLEQRIGRIDRFGQTAEKVLIFNFVTPGTVEERIFFRCFERLGIFRDTVGDCEEILGEFAVTEQLLEIARNPQLSAEQAEEQARQIADNAERSLEEQRRLEEEGGKLLGLDQAMLEDVESATATGRFVSGDELQALVNGFLMQPEFGGKVESDPDNPHLCWLRMNKEARTNLGSRLPSLGQPNRVVQDLRHWLEGNETRLCVTFDQETAVERREIPFITPVHPLARLAVQALTLTGEALAVSARSCDECFAPGDYVFCCELWESLAINPEVRLVTAAWYIDGATSAPDLADNLLSVLQKATSSNNTESSLTVLEENLSHLEERLQSKREDALTELRGRNESLINRKLANLNAYQQNRISRITAELKSAHNERIIRMKTAELNRAQRDFDQRRQDIEERRLSDIVAQRIALGILEVKHEV